MRRPISLWLETDRRFTTLVGLIKLAGLYPRLSEQGELTIFAVPNSAFFQLDPGAFSKIINQPKGSMLKNIGHHIVPGVHKLAHLQHGQKLLTEDGSEISIFNIDGVIRLNKSKLTEGDKLTSNGVIHIVDSIL